MGFNSTSEITSNMINGKSFEYQKGLKTPSQATTTNIWFDLSMSAPLPKYWFDATPLKARAITQDQDGGIYHGPNLSPSEKYLKKIILQSHANVAGTSTPALLYLLDYLLYYPTIDDGITDPQVMDNTVTLPRYSDGKGVQMMAVTTGARTGGETFTVSYTNSDGIAGRTSQVMTQNTYATVGTIATHNNSGTVAINGGGPFIALQDGDSGVRSVESVTMLGADTGLFSIILVKYIAPISIFTRKSTTAGTLAVPLEKDFMIHENTLPRIYDNAFLNFIINSTYSMSSNSIIPQLQIINT